LAEFFGLGHQATDSGAISRTICGIGRKNGICRHSRKEVTMTAGTLRTPVSTQYAASIDRELEHRLANFLYQRGVPGADRLRLHAQGGVVAVSGELPTQYAKWLCFECCRRLAGVFKIIDKMKVDSAISELPQAIQVAAEPMRRKRSQGDRSNGRNDWSIQRMRARKPATPGTDAVSQQRSLLAAA
jgi:hypothetical protein